MSAYLFWVLLSCTGEAGPSLSKRFMGGIFHRLRHPRRCYLVCATARSGSNLLTDGLHGTRKAGRPKQFFLPKFESEYGRRHGLDPRVDFKSYAEGIVPATATSNEVFGFKVMGWYLESLLERLRAEWEGSGSNLEMLRAYFPRLKFIRMVRRNKTRQAISKARALQSGEWKVKGGGGKNGPDAIEENYDPAAIRRCLRETEADEKIWDEFFATEGIQPHVVVYEDLCSDYEGTVRGVISFLGLTRDCSSPIVPTTVRQGDRVSDEWERRFCQLEESAE